MKMKFTIKMIMAIASIMLLNGKFIYQSRAESDLRQSQIVEGIVMMRNIRFVPETITVRAGTEIFWTNEDSVNYQISSDSGPISFDSGAIRPGEEYSFVFDTPGTYNYHCNIHPFMRGKVIVTQ